MIVKWSGGCNFIKWSARAGEQARAIVDEAEGMVHVMIACPATGRSIHTGLTVEPTDPPCFPHASAVGCPHCGDLHSWNPQDAWFDEGDGDVTSNAFD